MREQYNENEESLIFSTGDVENEAQVFFFPIFITKRLRQMKMILEEANRHTYYQMEEHKSRKSSILCLDERL